MVYNITGVANQTTILAFAQQLNDQFMAGWLGPVFLMGLFAIFFIGFYYSSADAKKSFAGSMFITFLCSVMLGALEMVPNLTIFICLIGLAIGIAAVWRN